MAYGYGNGGWSGNGRSSSWHGRRSRSENRDNVKDTSTAPGYDGKSPLRKYIRKARLYQEGANLLMEKQAGRLAAQLKDEAWDVLETLEFNIQEKHDSVEILLRHMEKELGLWGSLRLEGC
eukprot:TRINITY_DN31755_c0_g1_i1.p1 TRINITY_DN31755_c0_g1~~TRINITY_DN31755_c0_g1_i1.p1  ORF type:complete len:121 (+),score=13.58 TRINITY_DN31755_c0_g1_i1:356-718(+)